MGIKRTFDNDEFQDLPFKQARQVDCCNKLTQFEGNNPSDDPAEKEHGDRGSAFLNFQQSQAYEDNWFPLLSSMPKDFEINAPLSLVTSSSKDEDIYPVLFPGECLDFPRQAFVSPDDVYPSRKQVLIGPDHQATIPVWSGRAGNSGFQQAKFLKPIGSFSSSGPGQRIPSDEEEKLMGTCIIQMPDIELALYNSNESHGRRDCNCLDESSERCVQQHIREAREKLRKSLGNETFFNLGFMEMGEVVACKWSAEEERVFHEVVYSNPASLGQNFWETLSQVFPNRSTMEIVSYYFNVFMLRRRAIQNRSHSMGIDSDDDELPGISRTAFNVEVSEEDEDSDVESPVHQYNRMTNQTHYSVADGDGDGDGDGEEEEEEEDDDDSDNGGGDCATEEESGIDDVSNTFDVKSSVAGEHNPMVKLVNKNVEGEEDEFAVHDDSCTSFEFQPDKLDSSAQIGGVRSGVANFSPGKTDGCCDGSGQLFLLDSCDTKAWDACYMSPIRGVDQLPPTCNIIDEIFGQGSHD